MTEHAEDDRPIPNPRRTALKLGVLYVMDMLVAGQGGLSLLAAMTGLVTLMVAGGWSLARSDRPLAKSRLARAGLFCLLGISAYQTGGFHARHAERQAERIIQAAVDFEHDTGSLPSELSELVPAYLTTVPRSRYTLMYADFMYSARDSSHVLSYVVFPPFGRRLYGFETKSWGILD